MPVFYFLIYLFLRAAAFSHCTHAPIVLVMIIFIIRRFVLLGAFLLHIQC